MGTVTHSIGIGGTHDYSSLPAWAAVIPANLVTDGNAQVGQCYFNGSGDGEFVSATTLLTLSGHTTSSTYNITLTTGAGQSFRDNASVQTNASNYNASNGVGIRCSGAYNAAISAPDLNVVYSGLQIKAGVSASCIVGSGSTNIATIINCILTSGTGVVSTLDLKATNTLFLLTGSGRSAVVSVSSASAFYFCTIAASSDVVTKPTNGVLSSYGTCTLENCAVFGATNARSGSSAYTITTCMTDQASPPTGFTTVTYANQFVNTTIASGDFREKAGADLQGAGTADSTNGAFDIAGTARPQGTNWDIGCWELIVAATPSSVPIFHWL